MQQNLKDALQAYLETLRTHFADSERAPDWGFGALDYAFGAGIITYDEFKDLIKKFDQEVKTNGKKQSGKADACAEKADDGFWPDCKQLAGTPG